MGVPQPPSALGVITRRLFGELPNSWVAESSVVALCGELHSCVSTVSLETSTGPLASIPSNAAPLKRAVLVPGVRPMATVPPVRHPRVPRLRPLRLRLRLLCVGTARVLPLRQPLGAPPTVLVPLPPHSAPTLHSLLLVGATVTVAVSTMVIVALIELLSV